MISSTTSSTEATPYCSSHASTGEKRLDPATVPEDVRPVNIKSVGNYAISIVWSDGHDTGIYSYEKLKQLG